MSETQSLSLAEIEELVFGTFAGRLFYAFLFVFGTNNGGDSLHSIRPRRNQ